MSSTTTHAREQYRLGYVGLGNLGTEICKNLGRYASSHNLTPLTLYNRTSAKYTAVSDDCPGAHLAEDVAEVVERCDVVFTCLIDDAAAEEVYGKMYKAVKREAKVVFVDQSTLTPTTAGEFIIVVTIDYADGCVGIRKIGKSSSRSRSDIPFMPRLRSASRRQSSSAHPCGIRSRRRKESHPAIIGSSHWEKHHRCRRGCRERSA